MATLANEGLQRANAHRGGLAEALACSPNSLTHHIVPASCVAVCSMQQLEQGASLLLAASILHCVVMCRPEYCTASSDGTLRVWDLNTHQQLYEVGLQPMVPVMQTAAKTPWCVTPSTLLFGWRCTRIYKPALIALITVYTMHVCSSTRLVSTSHVQCTAHMTMGSTARARARWCVASPVASCAPLTWQPQHSSRLGGLGCCDSLLLALLLFRTCSVQLSVHDMQQEVDVRAECSEREALHGACPFTTTLGHVFHECG